MPSAVPAYGGRGSGTCCWMCRQYGSENASLSREPPHGLSLSRPRRAVRAGVTFFVKQFAPPPEAGGKRARGCVVVVRLPGGGMGHHPGVAAAPRGLCICRRCEDSRDGRWDVGHRGGQRAPVLNPFFFFFYELKTPRTRPPAAAAADASVMRSPPRRRQCRHRRPPAGLSLGGTARPGERRRSSRGAPPGRRRRRCPARRPCRGYP
jgi:hypothetical protein